MRDCMLHIVKRFLLFLAPIPFSFYPFGTDSWLTGTSWLFLLRFVLIAWFHVGGFLRGGGVCWYLLHICHLHSEYMFSSPWDKRPQKWS
jgi:hypothetical protein